MRACCGWRTTPWGAAAGFAISKRPSSITRLSVIIEELADQYLDDGRFARARELYDRVIASGRADSLHPYYRRGIAEVELGDFTAALADLEPVVSKDPKYDFHRAIGLLAHAHGRAGDPDKADALFKDATAISTLSETYYNYATFLAGRQRPAEAREWAERILAKKPTMPRYLRRRERPWFRKAKGAPQAAARYAGRRPASLRSRRFRLHRAIVTASNPNSARIVRVLAEPGMAPITGSTPSMRTGGTSAGIGPCGESTCRHAWRPASCGWPMNCSTVLRRALAICAASSRETTSAGRQRPQHAVDFGVHRVAMLDPQVIALKSLVRGEIRPRRSTCVQNDAPLAVGSACRR